VLATAVRFPAEEVRHGKNNLVRLWSTHPKYLDSKGLVALWREGLLALAVLRGKTKGYTHHAQLVRFRETDRQIDTIMAYLGYVFDESVKRGYHFDPKKIQRTKSGKPMEVTRGQLLYELEHLRKKLKNRNLYGYKQLRYVAVPDAHPLFREVPGDIEEWERL
jgi:Pyrimidine dimer DNA glycosylase